MIDVIIVNYEGGAMVLAAIKASLAGHDRGDIRFIVVDNGSVGAAHAALFKNRRLTAMLGGLRKIRDEPVELQVPFESIQTTGRRVVTVKSAHEVRTVRVTHRWLSRHGDIVIKLNRNHGYETGVNVALAVNHDGGFVGAPDCADWQSLSDNGRRALYRSYCTWLTRAGGRPRNDVVLLGSDVRSHTGCFLDLAKTARLHPKIGLVGAKLVQQQAGGLFVVGGGYIDDPEPLHQTGWDAAPGPWHQFQNCSWLTFSCVYITRKCLGAVGTMDMRLFPYAGDVDYSRRAREHGFANVYCPTALALHQHESTTVVRVMRAMPAAEWIARTGESRRYFFFKWAERHVPWVKLPAGVFGAEQNCPAQRTGPVLPPAHPKRSPAQRGTKPRRARSP